MKISLISTSHQKNSQSKRVLEIIKNIIAPTKLRNNLDKILLLYFEIKPIKAKLPHVQTNKLWNPIKKSVIANEIIKKAIYLKPKKAGT